MANVQDLNALFKEIYRDKVENLVPEGIQLLRDVPFREHEKVGKNLQVAVRLTDEENFTFTNDATQAVDLAAIDASKYLTASITPTTVVVRAQISYAQAAKALSKKQSIEVGTEQVFKSLKLSMDRKLEDAFFNGSRDILDNDGNVTGSTLKGLNQLLTSTGTLHGIAVNDASGRWAPKTYAAGGKLTVAKVQACAQVAVPFGLEGNVVLYINTAAYNALARELTKNIHDGPGPLEVPYSKGMVIVKPSLYVNLANGYLIKPDNLSRVGTTDPTFSVPGMEDQGPFHRMEGSNGFTVTLYTEQALFIAKPSQCVRLTGVTA